VLGSAGADALSIRFSPRADFKPAGYMYDNVSTTDAMAIAEPNGGEFEGADYDDDDDSDEAELETEDDEDERAEADDFDASTEGGGGGSGGSEGSRDLRLARVRGTSVSPEARPPNLPVAVGMVRTRRAGTLTPTVTRHSGEL
jgi:hypothetical protein